MKKILASTAILVAMSGGAFAQSAPAASSQSLLANLLLNASSLSASLSNVAENLNDVNGSITVDTSRDYLSMNVAIQSLSAGQSFGSFSQVNANVFGRDIPAALLNVLNPITLSLGDLSTTAIGAMQSGSITGTVNAGGIVDRVSAATTGSTTSANSMAENFGGIGQTVAFQNIAVNQGLVNGSVALTLDDVNTNVGKIGTTAIGAMGSGSLTATITGNMAAVASSTAGIVSALVN